MKKGKSKIGKSSKTMKKINKQVGSMKKKKMLTTMMGLHSPKKY